jgi:hypothetical protein
MIDTKYELEKIGRQLEKSKEFIYGSIYSLKTLKIHIILTKRVTWIQ